MQNVISTINLISFLILFIILTFASVEDYKHRIVLYYWWIILIIIGCIKIIIINILYLDLPILINTFISILIGVILSVILYKLKVFGGADFWAVFSTLLFIPTHQFISIFYNELYITTRILIFPTLSFFFNLGIIYAIFSIILLIYNILITRLDKKRLFEGHETEGFRKKIIILFSSILNKFDSKVFKFYYLREKIKNKQLVFNLNSSENYQNTLEIDNKNNYSKDYYDELKKSNNVNKDKILEYFKRNNFTRNRVWINPILPNIIFIIINLFILLIYGDIIYILVQIF